MSLAREDGFAPLNAYGFLSDGQAGALVAADGHVDWLAAPWMDRSPLCAALLDPAQGGTLELEPAVPYESEQRYVEGTLVLETTFRCADSVVRVTDALNRSFGGPLPWTELARRVEVVGDPVPMRWRIQLGHRLGSVRPWAERLGDTIYLHDSSARLAVVTDRAGEPQIQDAMVSGEFIAEADAPALVALVVAEDTPLIVPEPAAVQHRLDRTVGFWREWCQEIDYDGPHADEVRRSALVIKGLTRAPMEGLMAALTTSLPERVGGKRNFDYRFGWVRDASFALDAMSRLDLFEEVQGALAWLLRAVRRTAPEVRSMYTVEGEPAPAAMDSLEWLPGYRGSRPVNVGNTAASQLQLGGYGDLMDAVWRYCSGRARLDHDDAHALATLIDHTCDIWRSEDAGIWELGNQAHYTISKIGCWVAIDRGIRLAEQQQLPTLELVRWRSEREAVHRWVDENCWSEVKQSYTFYAGTDELDVAVLLAARTGFLAPDDPRLASTIAAIRTELSAGGPLLYRYSGQQEKEGAFLACTFWLIEAMSIAGQKDEAEKLLDEALGLCGPTGLFSEEIDPADGALLGNIPQVLSHLAVIGGTLAVHGSSGQGA